MVDGMVDETLANLWMKSKANPNNAIQSKKRQPITRFLEPGEIVIRGTELKHFFSQSVIEGIFKEINKSDGGIKIQCTIKEYNACRNYLQKKNRQLITGALKIMNYMKTRRQNNKSFELKPKAVVSKASEQICLCVGFDENGDQIKIPFPFKLPNANRKILEIPKAGNKSEKHKQTNPNLLISHENGDTVDGFYKERTVYNYNENSYTLKCQNYGPYLQSAAPSYDGRNLFRTSTQSYEINNLITIDEVIRNPKLFQRNNQPFCSWSYKVPESDPYNQATRKATSKEKKVIKKQHQAKRSKVKTHLREYNTMKRLTKKDINSKFYKLCQMKVSKKTQTTNETAKRNIGKPKTARKTTTNESTKIKKPEVDAKQKPCLNLKNINKKTNNNVSPYLQSVPPSSKQVPDKQRKRLKSGCQQNDCNLSQVPEASPICKNQMFLNWSKAAGYDRVTKGKKRIAKRSSIKRKTSKESPNKRMKVIPKQPDLEEEPAKIRKSSYLLDEVDFDENELSHSIWKALSRITEEYNYPSSEETSSTSHSSSSFISLGIVENKKPVPKKRPTQQSIPFSIGTRLDFNDNLFLCSENQSSDLKKQPTSDSRFTASRKIKPLKLNGDQHSKKAKIGMKRMLEQVSSDSTVESTSKKERIFVSAALNSMKKQQMGNSNNTPDCSSKSISGYLTATANPEVSEPKTNNSKTNNSVHKVNSAHSKNNSCPSISSRKYVLGDGIEESIYIRPNSRWTEDQMKMNYKEGVFDPESTLRKFIPNKKTSLEFLKEGAKIFVNDAGSKIVFETNGTMLFIDKNSKKFKIQRQHPIYSVGSDGLIFLEDARGNKYFEKLPEIKNRGTPSIPELAEKGSILGKINPNNYFSLNNNYSRTKGSRLFLVFF